VTKDREQRADLGAEQAGGARDEHAHLRDLGERVLQLDVQARGVMAKAERAREALLDRAARDEAAGDLGQLVGDAVMQRAALRVDREEAVLVAPRAKRPALLHVDEAGLFAIGPVAHVLDARGPGELERTKAGGERRGGAVFELGERHAYADPLPGRRESVKRERRRVPAKQRRGGAGDLGGAFKDRHGRQLA
jgi:hypothetical protein